MKRTVIILSSILWILSAIAQTDAYLKLFDQNGKHPRIESITFPGNANVLDMYNSIYGHGVVIENPWVAYRIYMDNRQSLDLYVKKTPRLELDFTGFYTTQQQMEEGYGCDVLWAGKSIGAGSFRGWREGNAVTIDTVASRTQNVIDSCTVEMIDKNWIFNGHPIQMTQRYTVMADRRDLYVEIKLEGHLPTDTFCTGIQKLENGNSGFLLPTGVAGSWGSNVPDKRFLDLIETVGLGIVVNPDNVKSVLEDSLNYLIFLRPDKEGMIRYKVISCGTREKQGFTNPEKWFEYIKTIK